MAEIALSFDNGPDPAATPRILEILARRDVTACFFVVGSKAATPDGEALVRDAHAVGHRIGNHTWSHSRPLGEMTDAAASVAEIRRTQIAIGDCSDAAKLFRPFGRGGAKGRHLLSPAAFRYLAAQDYTCVLWNCVPRDWEDADGWVARARTQIAAEAAPFLVLHDIAGAADRRLDAFLGAMQDAGHRFTSVVPDCEILVDRGVPRPEAQRYVAADTDQPAVSESTRSA